MIVFFVWMLASFNWLHFFYAVLPRNFDTLRLITEWAPLTADKNNFFWDPLFISQKLSRIVPYSLFFIQFLELAAVKFSHLIQFVFSTDFVSILCSLRYWRKVACRTYPPPATLPNYLTEQKNLEF